MVSVHFVGFEVSYPYSFSADKLFWGQNGLSRTLLQNGVRVGPGIRLTSSPAA